MKQWKLVLVALLTVLLVCVCTSALAEDEHKHNPADIYTAPTCGEPGTLVRWYCQTAGCELHYSDTEVIPATGAHAASVNYKTDMPTCETAGKNYFECPTCHKNRTEVVIPALGHDLQANATIKAATCEAEGSVRYVCANGCGKWEDRPTKALGHDKVVNEYITAGCGVEGATIWGCLNGCGQTWTEVTAPAKTHNFTVLYDHKDPTCTVDGHNIYACANNCGNLSEKEVIPALGHDFTAKVDSKAATCTEAGYDRFACSRGCGARQNVETDPAMGHDFSVKIADVAATCLTGGYKEYACANNCGNSEKTDIVEALGHNYVLLVEENVEPTCETIGSQTWKCTRCGSENIVPVDKIAHQYADYGWTVKVAATCTLDGTEKNTCIMCGGAEIERVLPAPGHDMGDEVVVVPATCLEDGEGYIKCNNCEYAEAVVIKAEGHDLEEEIVNDATCVLDGLKHIKCADCDYEELNIVIKAEGHKGEWVVTTPATPEADGEAKKICKVCGNELDRKVVPYTVMRYSNTATAFGPTTRELVGGSDWYRVTPIDLSVEGTFTYPLVASNQYTIGTVTVVISNGTLTVNYDVAAAQIKVTAESLLVYADKAALAAGNGQACAFGAPIEIGEDTKVMLSVLLTVDYDAIGAGVTGFAEDAAQIEAMKAIID